MTHASTGQNFGSIRGPLLFDIFFVTYFCLFQILILQIMLMTVHVAQLKSVDRPFILKVGTTINER